MATAKKEYERFGDTLRALRKKRGEPLRVVSAAIGIDSTLLSKLERGERLPTIMQVARFAEYFGMPIDALTAQVKAEKIVADYGRDATTLQALKIVKERISPYLEGKE